MTIFEKQMDFQQGLFSHPSSHGMATPDTFDLRYLTPEMLHSGDNPYFDQTYVNLNFRNPSDLSGSEPIPKKIYIRFNMDGDIDYIDALFPHREAKGEYEHIVSYSTGMHAGHRNIKIPDWMKYMAKKIYAKGWVPR